MNVTRFDRASVRGDAIVTDEGYIRANAVVTRTGIFTYKNSDGTIRKELRHPDDIWNDESMESMKMIPITNDHPQEKLLNADNSKYLTVGFTGETLKRDGDYVLSKIVITDKKAVEEITKNGKKELSLGYTVDLDDTPGIYNGESYDARQKNIKYNHLAIVHNARAGSQARIALDSMDCVEVNLEEISHGEIMTKRKIKIDEEEVFVEERTADYIDKLEDDLRNLTEEKARVDREIADIKDRLERAEAEKDSMQDKMSTMEGSTSYDSKDIVKQVHRRIALYKVAEANLDMKDLTKLDSMSDLDIQKQVIKACRKTINLDGKSEAYIEAVFDTILDDKKNSVDVTNVMFDIKQDSDNVSAEDSRKKMMEKHKNAYKVGGK